MALQGGDQVDGIRIDLKEVEGYLNKLILWVRILFMSNLVLSLIAIVIWNFFAPPHRDVSERVINKILSAVNSENFGALAPEPPNGTSL